MWLVLALCLVAAADDALRPIDKLIAAGKHREALASLTAAPSRTLAWHLLASRAYDGLDDPARAVAEAEAALGLDPRSEAANLQLGQIFLSRNTPQAALDVFSEALAASPDALLLRLGRGLALKELQRYDDAEAELLECLRRRPEFPVAFDALATVYLHQKRYAELERFAREYGKRQPGEYRAPYFVAAALDGAKTKPDAIAPLIEQSLRGNPSYAAAHALLGKIRLQSGDAAGAIAPLEEALRLRPDYTPAALHLAQAYQRAGRETDAERAYDRFRRLKESEQEPRPTLRYHRGKSSR